MSYTRSYSGTVSKTVTVHYGYPASQNGGSGSKSVTVDIPVSVTVHVDTAPFDRSVANCGDRVNALTRAIAEAEAAKIASTNRNATKIAETVTSGFLQTVRAEIGMQIAELSQKIDAGLLHLRELAKSCLAKRKQMERDYSRIANRYLKIFDDLNRELENRITELNKPAFAFKNIGDRHSDRATKTDAVGAAAVSGAECCELQARIVAAVVKRRAAEAIARANEFLRKRKELQAAINRSMLNENVSAARYAPVCFAETGSETGGRNRKIFQPEAMPELNPDLMLKRFDSQSWTDATREQKDTIRLYFNSEANAACTGNSVHDNRVRETLFRIFDLESMKTIRQQS
ncbi:MAG: hypothetical protein LBD35_04250 [Prevotellaceae bacterium]|jgi:hypothetical protein|nr:hypothetical protein [Prevotellaceae bacterium]